MTFSFEEKQAIYYIAKAMVLADDIVNENEMNALIGEFIRMGSNKKELQQLEALNSDLKSADAIRTLSQLENEKKKYVCSMLATIMVVDEDIDETETKLWSFICTICDFPDMSVSTAVKYLSRL